MILKITFLNLVIITIPQNFNITFKLSKNNSKFKLLKIVATFGTPTTKIWPGMAKLNFPKGFILIDQPFNNLKTHFPNQTDECLDLMYKMFVYDPEKRVSASDCFDHPYFDTAPLPCQPSLMPSFKTLLQKQRRAN